MALSGKTISVKAIIAKVYRDLRLTDEEPFVDFIEWCAEAMDFIHVYAQYEHKEACIEIKNFKAEIPFDFIQMEEIEHNGVNMRYNENRGNTTTNDRYLTPYAYNQDRLANVTLVPTVYRIGAHTVNITNGYFTTSFNNGKLNIKYAAMPLDEDGYPMIPDNVSFKEALYWYVVQKYLFSRTLTGEVNPQMYTHALERWNWYCNQAGAVAMMPDLLMLENLKRNFLSLRIRPNLFDNFYNDLNKNY